MNRNKFRFFLTKLAEFIFYGHFFVALCLLSSFLLSVKIYSEIHTTEIYHADGMLLTGTLFIYNLHASTPPFSPGKQGQWAGKNKNSMRMIAFTSLIPMLWFWVKINEKNLLLPLILLSIIYSIPKTGLLNQTKISSLPFKTFILTILVTYGIAFYPLFIIKHKILPVDLPYCANRFLLVFIICLLFDWKDKNSDREINLNTIVQNISKDKFYRLVLGLSFIGMLTALCMDYGYTTNLILVLPFVLIALLTHKTLVINSDLFYYWVIDGLLLVSPLFYLILSN